MTDPNGKVLRVEEEKVPFEVDDGSGARASISFGSTKVDIKGSEGDANRCPYARQLAMVQRQSPSETSTGRKRFTETALAVGNVVFVVGPARVIGDGGSEYRSGAKRLQIGAEADPTAKLVIQVGSAGAVLEKTTRAAWTWSAFAIGLALAATAAQLLGR
jgi:hypothetical protein